MCNFIGRFTGSQDFTGSPGVHLVTPTAASGTNSGLSDFNRSLSGTSLAATYSTPEVGPIRCLQSLNQKSGQNPSLHFGGASPVASTTVTTTGDGDSVLALTYTDKYIFSASQDGRIYVWDRDTYQLVHTLEGHMRSVLALIMDGEKKVLFSAGGDGKVKVSERAHSTTYN